MAKVRDRIHLPTKYGDAELYTFSDLSDRKEHVAVTFGGFRHTDEPLVRVHSECLTGDAFGSLRCDCGPQLDEFMKEIASQGGVLVYLRQEGRGIGLYNKIATYKLQESGFDTFQANLLLGFEEDERQFSVASEILLALRVRKVRLVTNNPDKVEQLSRAGIHVSAMVQHEAHVCKYNYSYLKAKREKGHLLRLEDDSEEVELVNA